MAMRNVAKFVSADGATAMTVSAVQGKSGINVKATMKGTTKGSERAITGARGNYQAEDQATEAYDALLKSVEAKGWKRTTARVKNAFTADAVPAPPTVVTKNEDGTEKAPETPAKVIKGNKNQIAKSA